MYLKHRILNSIPQKTHEHWFSTSSGMATIPDYVQMALREAPDARREARP